MKNYFITLLVSLFLFSCGDKKKGGQEEDGLVLDDIIGYWILDDASENIVGACMCKSTTGMYYLVDDAVLTKNDFGLNDYYYQHYDGMCGVGWDEFNRDSVWFYKLAFECEAVNEKNSFTYSIFGMDRPTKYLAHFDLKDDKLTIEYDGEVKTYHRWKGDNFVTYSNIIPN